LGPEFIDTPVIVATANNVHVSPYWQYEDGGADVTVSIDQNGNLMGPDITQSLRQGSGGELHFHIAGAVGVIHGASPTEFQLVARNPDVHAGGCSFYYCAIVGGAGRPQNVVIDTGEVKPKDFARGGQPNDWQQWEVYFRGPFLTPPVVLLTATDRGLPRGNGPVAAVGIAQNVTTQGFTLAARNSDVRHGSAAFNWVAVGNGIPRI
jgi:hypothetical protein